ncbi:MAG: pyrroline-5-carboxylate reductase, partial [Clostridium sp.]
MSKSIGFIGCGNMGKAILSGIVNKKFEEPSNIIVSRTNKNELDKLKEEFNINITLNNKEVAEKSDIVILAVKPNMYKKIIEEVKESFKKDAIIVSIAAGLEVNTLTSWIGENSKVVRTMPNTPAMVGEGMTAICGNKNLTSGELEYIKNLFLSLGEVEELEEKNFDAFTALCGSSPAYVFMFIEAMADGAVKLGIPRNKAYKMAAQTLLGSSKLLLETGKHPGELKDMVCSPGGTTIDAVAELERNSFRWNVISAMEVCANKSKSM